MTASGYEQTVARAPSGAFPGFARAVAAWRGRGESLLLGAILLLAAVLNVVRLDRQGLGNTYYAATVQSMLAGWRQFFFASYDSAGFVAVDKPPVGFWVQAAVAKVFGISSWSLLLPQAIAGVLSVALLFLLVRRVFGPPAALFAALTLAVTPVFVAIARNNTIDMLLILTLLAAAWALTRAMESGHLRWLLLGAALVGVGFNIKMLQAYLVVPAFALAYLLGSDLRWRTRIAHLLAALAVLLAVSLSWATAVALTPANQRPYVGSSQTNSAFDLAIGYNGLMRLLGGFGFRDSGAPPTSGALPAGMLFAEAGTPGPLRLFNEQLAGQIAWLLPLAALGAIVAWRQAPFRFPLGPQHRSLLLWGGWLATAAVFFSVAGMFHRYYLAMLAPPIAALTGIGLVALWRAYRGSGWSGWLLPAAILITTLAQVHILTGYAGWPRWLAALVLVAGLFATIGLAATRLGRLRPLIAPASPAPLPAAVAAAGIVALLAAPAAWASYALIEPVDNALPAAGPHNALSFGFRPGFGGDSTPGPAGDPPPLPDPGRQTAWASASVDPQLLAFLVENRGNTRFFLATDSAMTASPIMLQSGEPVAALGGFIGMDPILSDNDLAEMVAAGEMRFFLVPATDPEPDGSPPFRFPTNGNSRWVNAHCTPVPEAQWRSRPADAGAPFAGVQTLFDCAGAHA